MKTLNIKYALGVLILAMALFMTGCATAPSAPSNPLTSATQSADTGEAKVLVTRVERDYATRRITGFHDVAVPAGVVAVLDDRTVAGACSTFANGRKRSKIVDASFRGTGALGAPQPRTKGPKIGDAIDDLRSMGNGLCMSTKPVEGAEPSNTLSKATYVVQGAEWKSHVLGSRFATVELCGETLDSLKRCDGRKSMKNVRVAGGMIYKHGEPYAIATGMSTKSRDLIAVNSRDLIDVNGRDLIAANDSKIKPI